MQLAKFLLSGLCACAFTAQAGLPDYQAFPAVGAQRLLWVASEHGRAAPELHAAQQLAAQGVEVWSLDPVNAYFLPQLPGSMDDVPVQDLTDWLRLAQDGGKLELSVDGGSWIDVADAASGAVFASKFRPVRFSMSATPRPRASIASCAS